jgi:hypothetical protein
VLFAFLIDLVSFLILVRLRLDWIALGVGCGLVLGSRKALALPAERGSARAGGRQGEVVGKRKGGQERFLALFVFWALAFLAVWVKRASHRHEVPRGTPGMDEKCG